MSPFDPDDDPLLVAAFKIAMAVRDLAAARLIANDILVARSARANARAKR